MKLVTRTPSQVLMTRCHFQGHRFKGQGQIQHLLKMHFSGAGIPPLKTFYFTKVVVAEGKYPEECPEVIFALDGRRGEPRKSECEVERWSVAVGRWFIRRLGVGLIAVKSRGRAGPKEHVACDGGVRRERQARRLRLGRSPTRLLGGRRRRLVWIAGAACVDHFGVEM